MNKFKKSKIGMLLNIIGLFVVYTYWELHGTDMFSAMTGADWLMMARKSGYFFAAAAVVHAIHRKFTRADRCPDCGCLKWEFSHSRRTEDDCTPKKKNGERDARYKAEVWTRRYDSYKCAKCGEVHEFLGLKYRSE